MATLVLFFYLKKILLAAIMTKFVIVLADDSTDDILNIEIRNSFHNFT